MKFTVQRDLFQQAIASVQRATATRVIQPILSNILVESVGSNELLLSATDLDFAIQTTVSAGILEAGRTTLSAKKLFEIVSKLPSGQDVTFEIDDKTQTAHIQCGTSRFDVRTLPADEFPLIKQIDEASYMDLSLKAMVRAINQTAFAAASYDSNNVLGGVYFQLNQEGLEMAATDGSRLARRTEAGVSEKTTLEQNVVAIIPVKALQEFVKLVDSKGNEGDTVRLAIQDGQIAFRTPRVYVLSRLLDGQYPKYNQLIPAENKFVAYADRKALIESLERTAVMANERTNVVKLQFENGHLSLAAQTPDVGDSRDMLSVHYSGEPLNIAFNYKFLLDALRVIETDDVRMETNGMDKATLFRSKEENDYLCLVMPVQVK